MDRISGLSQLINTLRKQIDPASGRKTRASAKNAVKMGSTTMAETASVSIEQLERRIMERIKALDDDDRNSHKSSYVFVESILAWEFGEHLLKDPDFYEVINKVHQTILGNSALTEKINRIIDDFNNQ